MSEINTTGQQIRRRRVVSQMPNTVVSMPAISIACATRYDKAACIIGGPSCENLPSAESHPTIPPPKHCETSAHDPRDSRRRLCVRFLQNLMHRENNRLPKVQTRHGKGQS